MNNLKQQIFTREKRQPADSKCRYNDNTQAHEPPHPNNSIRMIHSTKACLSSPHTQNISYNIHLIYHNLFYQYLLMYKHVSSTGTCYTKSAQMCNIIYINSHNSAKMLLNYCKNALHITILGTVIEILQLSHKN